MLNPNNWPNIIQQWLYPPTCLLCTQPGHGGLDLCLACQDSLPFNREACPICGIPIPARREKGRCGRCSKKQPPFDSTFALFTYDEPVRYLIRSLKYNANYPVGRLLGSLMAQALLSHPNRPQLIIPVPLHPIRFRERGFNQAIEIARPISKTLGIPIALDQCVRTKETQVQSGLPARQRTKNIKHAFNIRQPIEASHVAILDDVVTTGATVTELAKTLHSEGINQIDIWACARA